MINISINSKFKKLIQQSVIETVANKVFSHLKVTNNPELSIVINNDQFIQNLNFEFRGLDEPTDVLSFPSDEIDPQTGIHYLGDIIISFPRAVDQAQKGSHSVQDEMSLLTIHGILHLLGYDHEEMEDQKVMWKIQRELLTELGCQIEI